MNPFDLKGPDFLFFYVVLSAAVFVGTRALVAWLNRTGAPRGALPLDDPFLIAQLRGGRDEVLRVVVTSLVDRKLLAVDEGGRLTAAPDDGAPRRPLERAVLRACAEPKSIAECRLSADFRTQCDVLALRLTDLGFPSGQADAFRERALFVLAAGLLFIVGAYKLVLAVERGRSNIGFLFVLTFANALVGGWFVLTVGRRSRLKVLGDLRTLFADLKHRARKLAPGKATHDVEYLTAVYGIGAVPLAVFPYAAQLFPVPNPDPYARKGRRPADGGGCGTTTVGGDGCGGAASSCGGGCGGGGCGGCGGCGS